MAFQFASEFKAVTRDVLVSQLKTQLQGGNNPLIELLNSSDFNQLEKILKNCAKSEAQKNSQFNFLNKNDFTYNDLLFQDTSTYLQAYQLCQKIISTLTGRTAISYNLSYTTSKGEYKSLFTKDLSVDLLKIDPKTNDLIFKPLSQIQTQLSEIVNQQSKAESFLSQLTMNYANTYRTRAKKTRAFTTARNTIIDKKLLKQGLEISRDNRKKIRETNYGFGEEGYLSEGEGQYIFSKIFPSRNTLMNNKRSSVLSSSIFSAIKGRTPWYRGGDVGNIQYKNLSSTARVTSLSSIKNLVNLFYNMKQAINSQNTSQIDILANKMVNILYESEDLGETFLQETVTKDLEGMIEESLMGQSFEGAMATWSGKL